MSFFSNLFGKDKGADNPGGQISITPEAFFQTQYISNLIQKYKRTATVLNPRKSQGPVPPSESKFGGLPNFEGFATYPCCDSCGTPLNFVLQLYKKDFPAFYFPGNTNLFQLFRCPNYDCSTSYSELYDHKMFHYYFEASPACPKQLPKPPSLLKEAESEVPDCYLVPMLADDFPNFDDFEDDDFNAIEKKYGSEYAEIFMDQCFSLQRTKFGGYPSYTQSPVYPTCACGNTKDFFFQLSSEDHEEGQGYSSSGQWSSHGIMIGDVGNIYYYICKACGPESIESNWDCY